MLPMPPSESVESNDPNKTNASSNKSWSSMLPNVGNLMTRKNMIFAGTALAGVTGAALMYFGMFKKPQANANLLKAANPTFNLPKIRS